MMLNMCCFFFSKLLSCIVGWIIIARLGAFTGLVQHRLPCKNETSQILGICKVSISETKFEQ